MFTALPKDPAQPDAITYQPRDLEILPQYDHDAYVKTFGEEPPAPLAAYPAKYWADTSKATQGEGTIYYQYIDPADGVQRLLALDKSIARRVNIPGKVAYPAYTPVPTPATVIFNGTLQRGADPADFSTRKEAEAMKTETGASAILDGTPKDGLLTVALNGETRVMWRLIYPDGREPMNVGQLLVEKNRYGIGAPVKVITEGVTSPPDWALTETNESVAKGPATPVPQRGLLPNEIVLTGAFGVQIKRTDMDNATPATGGGLTAEQDTILRETNAIVKRLETK